MEEKEKKKKQKQKTEVMNKLNDKWVCSYKVCFIISAGKPKGLVLVWEENGRGEKGFGGLLELLWNLSSRTPLG